MEKIAEGVVRSSALTAVNLNQNNIGPAGAPTSGVFVGLNLTLKELAPSRSEKDSPASTANGKES